ncbi:unnamed protein product [Ectocarpus sp. 12 AP-2014]
MNPIKFRLNRDNFWNLMFWLGLSVGWFLTLQFSGEQQYIGTVICWTTLIGVPYLVKKASRITFNENKEFLNHQGEVLNKRIPNGFWLIFSTFAVTALLGSILDSWKNISDITSTIILISVFFMVPTLHFVSKNCPIAILFHKNFWSLEKNGANQKLQHNKMIRSSMFSHENLASKNICTDSSYRGMSCNIYNSNHNK